MQQQSGPTNIPEYSVGDIARAIKQTMEGAFARVRVRGEISGLMRPRSGHIYFDLKDDGAVLASVSWKGMVPKLGLAPEDGMEVIAIGRITTYAPRSSYQLVVERMELAGEGALLKLLEARKAKLAAEGLFAPERKQQIPTLPRHIGVVTSPTGAVIRDILHRLAERFPTRVTVWPVRVQGDGADQEVAAGIRGFNAMPDDMRPDLIIVARGGGSLEDLMPFNEECVVRAAAESALPLISAVGHETDTTLIDHAADLRAPTPTAAAELAVPVRRELVAKLDEHLARISAAWDRRITDHRYRAESLMRHIGDPARLLEGATQKLDDMTERLDRAADRGIITRRQQAQHSAARLPHPRQQVQMARQRQTSLGQSLDGAMTRLLERAKMQVSARADRLSIRQIIERLERMKLDTARLEQAGSRAMQARFKASHDRLNSLTRLLESTSHKRILARGFVLVRDAEGQAITTSSMAQKAGMLDLEFGDGGHITALPSEGSMPKPTSAKRKPAKAKTDPDGQGELL